MVMAIKDDLNDLPKADDINYLKRKVWELEVETDKANRELMSFQDLWESAPITMNNISRGDKELPLDKF